MSTYIYKIMELGPWQPTCSISVAENFRTRDFRSLSVQPFGQVTDLPSDLCSGPAALQGHQTPAR